MNSALRYPTIEDLMHVTNNRASVRTAMPAFIACMHIPFQLI